MNISAQNLPPIPKAAVNPVAAYLRFCWAGLVNHGQTGGIVPSQRYLIAKMIAPVPATYCGKIIELGAGTGALTFRLASRCPQARILSCEINPALAQGLQNHLDSAGLSRRVEVFNGSAARLFSETVQGADEPSDFIISGIPLANLGRQEALALVKTIHRTLRVGGVYIQFQHSLLDRKKIKVSFPRLRTVPAFFNFPPAFVYIAQK